MSSRLHVDRIARAAGMIDPVFLNTPQFQVESLEPILGCRLVLKVEILNPIQSFKGRGASWFVSRLPMDAQLVCASAGNFGRAMAYCCRSRGIGLTVFASTKASALKVERIRSLGAEVRLVGEDFDAAKLAAKDFVQGTGGVWVEDSLEVATCEGAGTIGLELLRWPEPLDAILVALGNGGMLTGIARWVKTHAPPTRIIGVCATGAPAMADSWHTGQLVTYPAIRTIAEGIGVRIPISEVLADMEELVDDVLLVTDEALVQGMRLLHEHVGLVVEPSGAAGIAALLTHADQFRKQRVAAVACGGNLPPEHFREFLC